MVNRDNHCGKILRGLRERYEKVGICIGSLTLSRFIADLCFPSLPGEEGMKQALKASWHGCCLHALLEFSLLSCFTFDY